MSLSYQARQLLVFKWYMTLSNGTQQLITKYFSTDETVYNGIYYEPRIIDEIETSQSIPEQYNGFANFDTFTVRLSNADSLFYFRLEGYIYHWKPDFRGAEITVFWQRDNDPPVQIAYGTVISHTVSDVVVFECQQMDYRPFQVELPKCRLEKTYKDDNGNQQTWEDVRKTTNPNHDFSKQFIPEKDIGKPIPIVFGYARKIPARFVWADYVNNKFIYAFSCRTHTFNQQNLLTQIQVSTIYRGDVAIPFDSFAENGINLIIDSSPYARRLSGLPPPSIHYLPVHHPLAYQRASLAYIVFDSEQKDFTGNYFEISVTAGFGHRIETFETAIWDIMTDSVLGLGLQMSPTSRPSLPQNLQDALACDGYIAEPIKAQQLLEEWLWHYGGYIERVGKNIYKLNKDRYISTPQYTWTSDEVIDISERKRMSFENSPKKIILEYRRAGNEYPYKLERDIYINDGGQELTKQSNFTRKIKDADRITCYRQRRYLGCDEMYTIKIGYYGLMAKLGEIVHLKFLRAGLEIDRIGKITKIRKDLTSAIITIEPHSEWIYEYDYLNWKDSIDEIDPYAVDSESPPLPPTNITLVSTETITDAYGYDKVRVKFRCNAPVIAGKIPKNFSKIYFLYQEFRDVGEKPQGTFNLVLGYSKSYAILVQKQKYDDGSETEIWEWTCDRLNPNPITASGKIYYHIIAVSESKVGISSRDNPGYVLIPPQDTQAPQPPLAGWGLTADSNTNSRTITISWNKSISRDVDSYLVECWQGDFDRLNTITVNADAQAGTRLSAVWSVPVERSGNFWFSVIATDKSGNAVSFGGINADKPIPPGQITQANLPSTYLDISNSSGIRSTITDGYQTTIGMHQYNGATGMLHVYRNNQLLVKAGQTTIGDHTASLYANESQGNTLSAYFQGKVIVTGQTTVKNNAVVEGNLTANTLNANSIEFNTFKSRQFIGWKLVTVDGSTFYTPMFA